MYNNHYGKQKDGTVLAHDPFMTIGKSGKWDYVEEGNLLRIFNPDTNETIFTQRVGEIQEYYELDEIGWDEITDFINSQCCDVILSYYRNHDIKTTKGED